MNPANEAADIATTVSLLELELKRLDDARRDRGWTPWVLLAALGALCWKGAEYLAHAQHWERTGLYWAMFVVIGLTAESLVGLLNSSREPTRPGIRYYPANLLAAGRAARLFVAVELGIAGAILCWLTPLTGLVKVAWLVLFGFYVYAVFAYVAGSWTDFPQPVGMSRKRKASWLVPSAIWCLHVGLVATTALALWSRLVGSYDLAEARLALLGFAITYLTYLLLAFRVDQPLRHEFIHLRRQIGLGELAAAQARQRLSELIYGSELSVLLRPRFKVVEEAQREHRPFLQGAESALRELADGGNADEAKSCLKEAIKRFDAMEWDWIALDVRVRVCSWFNELPTDVASRHAELKKVFEADVEQLNGLKAAFKQASYSLAVRPI